MLVGLEQEWAGVQSALKRFVQHEFFLQPEDKSDARVSVTAGGGGVEARDFAKMLSRMYLAWATRQQFKIKELACAQDEFGGFRHSQFLIAGENAYGWLKGEQGVHRLTRHSPYGAGLKQTSFASVRVESQVMNERLEVALEAKDVELQTYRSSGKGGQHVNKTSSAVRLRHKSSGLTVTCQEERSQHANRAKAMAKLKSRLEAEEEACADEARKSAWGSQEAIEFGRHRRTYALCQSRITDTLTGVERFDVERVLNGHLEPFLSANLK